VADDAGNGSERFPRGGALLMGIDGYRRTLSIRFVLPKMGAIFDNTKVSAAGGEAQFNALKGVDLDHVLESPPRTSFPCRSDPPALLLLVFGAIWFYDKSKGGFKATKPLLIGVRPLVSLFPKGNRETRV